MNFARLAFAAALAVSLAACSGEAPKPAATAGYPLKTCVVSGEELGPDRVSIQRDGVEVQFCCKDCIAKFEKDPAKYLAMVKAAK